VNNSSGIDESHSVTFEEFRDKWEAKFYKWDKLLHEIVEADMSE
jgi:hypothetical protein